MWHTVNQWQTTCICLCGIQSICDRPPVSVYVAYCQWQTTCICLCGIQSICDRPPVSVYVAYSQSVTDHLYLWPVYVAYSQSVTDHLYLSTWHTVNQWQTDRPPVSVYVAYSSQSVVHHQRLTKLCTTIANAWTFNIKELWLACSYYTPACLFSAKVTTLISCYHALHKQIPVCYVQQLMRVNVNKTE